MSFVERPTSGIGQATLAADSEQTRLRTRVGATLEDVRVRLAALAARLEHYLDPHALPIVTEVLNKSLATTGGKGSLAVVALVLSAVSSFISKYVGDKGTASLVKTPTDKGA